MRFESFHVIIKLILSAVASKICIVKSVAVRHELRMISKMNKKYESAYIKYGDILSNNLHVEYPQKAIAIASKSITINDVNYTSGFIIIVPGKDFSDFRKIDNVYVLNDRISL